MEDVKLSFTEHLEELRKRIIYIIIPIFVGFFVCFYFARNIFNILMVPILKALPNEEGHLNITSPVEAIITYMKVAFIASIFLNTPNIFYQVWKFVAPGLYDHEKKYVIPLVFASSFFFIGGALFGYYIVFPVGFKYLIDISLSETIKPILTVKEYFSISIILLFGFGICFELPLIMLFLSKIGIVSVSKMNKYRKYWIIISFIIGAILTPPDVISQVMLSIPLIFLYEIGIIGAKLFGKK